MTPALNAPADDVEKFLEEKDKTWGVDAGCMIKFDEIKRLLRLCRRYRLALRHVDAVSQVYFKDKNGDVNTRVLASECIGEAREALAYTGTEEK